MKRKVRRIASGWLVAAVTAGLAGIWWISHNSATPPNAPSTQTNEPPTQHTAPGGAGRQADQVESKSREIGLRPETNSAVSLMYPDHTRDVAVNYPRPIQNVFELQLALTRQGLSPGSLDGVAGPQTHAALTSFQQKCHLPPTGELDVATRQLLLLSNAPTMTYLVSSNDVSRLQPLSPTWLGKSQQSALEYETLLELVSEKAQSSPSLIRRLNPAIDWATAGAGAAIEVPDVSFPAPPERAAYLTIRLGGKILEAWDENTNLLAHFPCSIARLVEKRPVGELHVAVIAQNPNYTFDPVNFPESPEAQTLSTKLILPPGPNNPVGVAWIGLDKPGYGIHGTPLPEQVGRTESHGCFRLANWNVEHLVRLVKIGTPVQVQP